MKREIKVHPGGGKQANEFDELDKEDAAIIAYENSLGAQGIPPPAYYPVGTSRKAEAMAYYHVPRKVRERRRGPETPPEPEDPYERAKKELQAKKVAHANAHKILRRNRVAKQVRPAVIRLTSHPSSLAFPGQRRRRVALVVRVRLGRFRLRRRGAGGGRGGGRRVGDNGAWREGDRARRV